jgi:electron transfer flavoprotein alpha/beta subunit
LTGAATLDTGQGQLGGRLAEALGQAQILDAWQVEVIDGKARAALQRRGDFVTVETTLPAVITIVSGALKPRYPDGVRLVNVYQGVGEVAEAVEEWSVSDLVDADALRPLLRPAGRDFPPERERGVRVDGTPEEMAQAVLRALRQRMGR